jgi:carbon-monoxide dehydrogenase medium subunit
MKPAPFDYARPATVIEAIDLLQRHTGEARVLAGGQSLGPMLNLRLAQPELIVDIGAIGELRQASESEEGIEIGACVTHAMFEDGRVPDVTCGLMRHVAADIAYRAIRNRGTIGGSVCHADPAADWLSVLILLSARVSIVGKNGMRTLGVEQFVRGSYETALAEDEIVVGIRIPRLPPGTRWAYYKVCRKPGEFAEAIVAAMASVENDRSRVVLGAIDRVPHMVEDATFVTRRFDQSRVQEHIAAAGVEPDSYRAQICLAAMRRVARQLEALPA